MENIVSQAEESLMDVVYGDGTLGVHGEGFSVIFSYTTGGPESLVYGGKEWLYRTAKPTFWRATTDNDRGNQFSRRASQWLGADLFTACTGQRVWMDGKEVAGLQAPENDRFGGSCRAGELKIEFTYETPTVPRAEVRAAYTVSPSGSIRVDVEYQGREGLPGLPVFGMRFIAPTPADGYTWTGLSGETYPDRMRGGVPGTYTAEGMPVTPYLVPQDCQVHMETSEVTVRRSTVLANTGSDGEPFSLTFAAIEQPFAFSCLPYTAEELENATHQEELPPRRRTVICILGAVRGVGGINSWGAQVGPEYEISGEGRIAFSFAIRP